MVVVGIGRDMTEWEMVGQDRERGGGKVGH